MLALMSLGGRPFVDLLVLLDDQVLGLLVQSWLKHLRMLLIGR